MEFDGACPFIPSCLQIIQNDDDLQLQHHLIDVLQSQDYCAKVDNVHEIFYIIEM